MKSPFYKAYLQDELARRCERNPRYSVRAFARALDINDGALSQILSGKRVPAFKTAQRIIKALALAPDEEHEFIASLAEKHRSRGLQRMSPIFRDMKLQPKPVELTHDMFRVIADWYHSAIIELTFVENFRSDPAWISQELGISVIEAKLAVERLLSVGLLKEEGGQLVAADRQRVTNEPDKTAPALKKHIKQTLEKAIYSLENDAFEDRYMYGFTFPSDPADLPEARAMIADFAKTFSKHMSSKPSKKVFQFGICLYPVQKLRDQARSVSEPGTAETSNVEIDPAASSGAGASPLSPSDTGNNV